jgi:uncharacterized HAD superfamily protein
VNIGFDIDGVLTDNSTWFQAVEKKFGLKYKDVCHAYKAITDEQAVEMIDEYNELIYRDAVATVGALNVVREMNKGHEIYYITARPEKYLDMTLEWLKAHHFPMKEGRLISSRDKAKTCSDLNIKMMVEDCGEHANELAEAKVLSFLINNPYNKNIETDKDWVVRVNNMNHLAFMFPAAECLMGVQDNKRMMKSKTTIRENKKAGR